jgi:beta-lactamase class A
VLEIDGAGECSLGADDVVTGASTFKLAVALELYCRAASDGLDVNQRIAFQADRSIASKASLREAAMMMMTMMTVSDNAAADALIDLLGAETITTRLHQDGATHTTVRPGVQAEVRAITAELDPYAVAAGFDGWHDLCARHSSRPA